MKRKILSVVLAGMMVLTLAACGEPNEGTKEPNNKPESTQGTESKTTYQNILDDYTKKIVDATPGLVEEYNTEAEEKAGDINALAELSTAKIEKLAKICNEGVEKMAELKLKNGDDDATYNDWAKKLQDVYTEQSKKITDAYTKSVTGK